MLHSYFCEFLKFLYEMLMGVHVYISLVCSLFCSAQNPVVISRYEGVPMFHYLFHIFI